MRDALHVFGAITLATDTTVYSADEVYLGTITAAYRRTLHALGHIQDLWVRFIVTTVGSGGTSAQPGIYAAGTTAPTTLVQAGPAIATATLALGYATALHVPLEVANYVRAGAFTVGAITGTLNASLAFGPNIT